MRLFLARHGNTDWTERGLIQGHTNIPLNDLGRESAKRLAQELAAFQDEIGLVISSDLLRASETAQIVASHLAKPIVLDARLREAAFGSIEGMTKDQVTQAHGPIMERSIVEWDFRSLGGENHSSVIQRYTAAMEDYGGQLPAGSCLLIVGHGRSLSTLSRHLGQHENFQRPASWVSIETDQGLRPHAV